MIGSRRHGFTLIELLVVITIMVTLSAMAFPIMSGSMERSEARGTITRLTSMVGLAQSYAVHDRETYRLNVNPEAGEFWLSRQADLEENPGVYTELKQSNIGRISLGDSLKLTRWKLNDSRTEDEKEKDEEELGPGVEYIEFRLDGTADEALFVFETPGGDEYTMMISGMTGRVRVLDFAIEDEE